MEQRQKPGYQRRARHYLFRLLPELITHLAKAGDPDAAFARFADLVAALPAQALQAFSLLCQHPQLASLITDILVKAPALTNTIGRRTDVLDILLEPDFFTPLEGQKELAQICPQIRADEPVELYLDRLKRWAHEARFESQCAYAAKNYALSGGVMPSLPDCRTGYPSCFHRSYSGFSNTLWPGSGQQLAYSCPWALGSQTMTARSDIDLLFVYEGEPESLSDGPRSLGLTAYYISADPVNYQLADCRQPRGSLYG